MSCKEKFTESLNTPDGIGEPADNSAGLMPLKFRKAYPIYFGKSNSLMNASMIIC